MRAAAAASLAGAVVAAFTTGSLLVSPGPSLPATLYLAPVVYDGRLLGPFAANSSSSSRSSRGTPSTAAAGVGPRLAAPPAYWYAAQWDNPLPVTANATVVPGPSPGTCAVDAGRGETVAWRIDNGALRVCTCSTSPAGDAISGSSTGGPGGSGSGGVAVEVAADGSGSGGAPEVACGSEFDAFLSPNDGSYTPSGVPDNLIPLAAGAPSLAGMSSLTLNFTAQLTDWEVVAARCGPVGSCGPSGHLDYGYATASLVLHNAVAPPPQQQQTLFFQVILADTRAAYAPCAGNDPCTTNSSDWFFDALPTLGVSVSTLALGVACLRPNAPAATAYSLPLLPRLADYLAQAAARFGADGDLSHWGVSGLYVGVGLEGSVRAGLKARGVTLTYEV